MEPRARRREELLDRHEPGCIWRTEGPTYWSKAVGVGGETQEMGAASQHTILMPIMCQLSAGCADGREGNQTVTPHPKELLAQWGKQTCSLQRTPGVMVMQWSVGSACGWHHRG